MGDDSLHIMFLSAETSHTDIFCHILEELEKLTKGKMDSIVLDTNKLNIRQPSLAIPYKLEFERIEQIMKRFKPSILVVANDQGVQASFIRMCTAKRIPSLAIQDGILTNQRPTGTFAFLSWRNYMPWRMICSVTDVRTISRLFVRLGRQWAIPCWGLGEAWRIAAIGDYYKRVFVSRGIRPDKVVVTGYPLLDDVPRYSSEFNAEGFYEKVRLRRDKPVILLITQPFVEDCLWSPTLRDLFVKTIVDTTRRVNGQLIIKLHPRDNLDSYKTMVDKYHDVNIVVGKDISLHESLVSSDIVVTVSSTVGLWALAYRKPLVIMPRLSGASKNVLEDMAIIVDKMQEIPKTCRLILEGKLGVPDKMWKTLHDHVYRLDGKASERVALLILDMVRKPLKR